MKSAPLSYLAALWTLTAAASLDTITVHGNGVAYTGVYNKTAGINTFWGIRYAKPPVKDLRWRPPVIVQHHPEHGTTHVDATKPGASCPQTQAAWNVQAAVDIDQDEDCLLLNIQTPMHPVSDKLPVLVFIHGGGYVAGNTMKTTGDSLVFQSNGSMIYVSLQYRLGPLGFLAGDDVMRNGTANAGLLDQRAAMQWIKDNIHIFGGDASSVTISGESAGGGSVLMQLVLQDGKAPSPFHAAIAEYPWVTPMYSRAWQNDQYQELLDSAECSNLDCLRSLSLQDLLTASGSASGVAYKKRRYAYGTFYWGPAIDGTLIQNHPLQELRNGRFARVPVMVHRNYDEGFGFSNMSLNTDNELRSDMSALWSDSSRKYIDLVTMLYPSTSYNATHIKDLTALDSLEALFGGNLTLSNNFFRRSAMLGDALINCPTSSIAQSVAAAGLPAFKLIFNAGYQLHGATLPFIRSDHINADGTLNIGSATTPGDAQLAAWLRTYFISFVLHRDPNKLTAMGVQPPRWPQYGLDGPEVAYVEGSEIRSVDDPDLTSQCYFFGLDRGEQIGSLPVW